jgi:hypothetical protein
VSYDVSWPGGLVGKPCNITTQCEMEGFSTTCLGWSKKGYCTIKDCGDGTTGVLCPDGSLCMGVSLKQPVCIQSCASDADCRVRDGFACKLMPDASGAMQSICHEVDVPGATGDGCLSASECAGEAGCLATFPGGYCTLLSCKDRPCPGGAACVLFGGESVCLKSCVVSADCQVAGNLPRACVTKRDAATFAEVLVCGSSEVGAAIGKPCLNETECASGRCEVIATGRCSFDSDRLCKLDNDCGLNQVCQNGSDKTLGLCSADCSASIQCPNPAYCVETLVFGTLTGKGRCMAGCTQNADCGVESGVDCIYGDPLLDPGRYACAMLVQGEIGTRCQGNSDCRQGFCLQGQGAASGYCTFGCDKFTGGGHCPFPTTCGDFDAQQICMRRCLSDADCLDPTVLRCDTNRSLPVCIPVV